MADNNRHKNALYESVDSTTSGLTRDLEDDAEPPKLPKLPQLPTKPGLSKNRKRDRDEYLASSSDAPLFSSDDLPSSSADNYLGRRQKRQYQRAWFELEDTANLATNEKQSLAAVEIDSPDAKTPLARGRGPFTRAFDSGVWLGSDETEINEELDLDEDMHKDVEAITGFGSFEDEEIAPPGQLSPSGQVLEWTWNRVLTCKAMQTTEDAGDFEGLLFPYWQKQPENLQEFHALQREAQKKVITCVETGDETVDLSGLHLQRIRAPTLRPLRYHMKQVSQQDDIDVFEPLTPSLCLYLSNNALDDVPGEVYHLENLDVLSLRSNNITEILPSISKLVNLREANFGSNQLKWLPWEFIGLLHTTRHCVLGPNPFLSPIPAISTASNCLGRDCPGHCASTHTAFLDITGKSERDYPPAPTSIQTYMAEPSDNVETLRPPLEEWTKTPSLAELAIRACYNTPYLSQLPFLLPDDCPVHLRELLESTWKLKEAGGQRCSLCGNEYIIPRTEWVEWWCSDPDLGFPEPNLGFLEPDLGIPHSLIPGRPGPECVLVPFLRRGCSWQCFVEPPKGTLIRGWSSATEP